MQRSQQDGDDDHATLDAINTCGCLDVGIFGRDSLLGGSSRLLSG